MGAWTMPNLSVRNSTLPPFTSRTARATSLVTVPDFGLGIRPRGPRIFPSGPTRDIRSRLASPVADREDGHPNLLASAVGQDDRPADHLLGVPRIDAQPDVGFNSRIELGDRRVLGERYGLFRGEPAVAVGGDRGLDLLGRLDVFLPVSLRHLTLLDDLEAHRPRRTFDHLHRRLGLVGVEVLPLGLDDGPDLLLGHAADLLAVRFRRSLLHAGGALEQVHSRRGLEHECEAAVLEDRDLGGDDVTRLRGGALVVGLGELHDVDAVRPERGAHRRRRRRAPGLKLELQDRAYFLLRHLVDLLDLQQVQLHRRLTAEHVDQHLELALLGVDLVDLAVEVGERTVDNAHRLADLELDTDLRRLLLHLLLDGTDLFLLQRHRAVRGTHEARDARRVANDEPRLVRHHHAHQDVAGEDSLLHVAALAVLDLDLVLHRDEHLQDLVLHVHGLDPLLEVLLDLLLVAGVRVDDVPLRLGLGPAGRRALLDCHQCCTYRKRRRISEIP